MALPEKILLGDRSLAKRALLERAARATSGFDELGIGQGDAVALLLRNDFAYFEATLAAGALGAYSVPINWHFQADEVKYVLSDSGAKALVVHADMEREIRKIVPGNVAVLVVPTPSEVCQAYGITADAGRVSDDAIDWDAWVGGHPRWGEEPRMAPHSMAYTSGTTGRPKGVRREQMTPEFAARAKEMVACVFGVKPGMRTVITGPLYHSAPNLYGMTAVQLGGTVVLQPRFDPEELLGLIERHRITHLHMVPTMFVRLLRLPEALKDRYDLSSLEFVVHAAAPCSPTVKKAMIDWWGPIISEYYGSTESAAVTFCTSDEWLSHPGTVGHPIEHATVRILGEDGAQVPAGEHGEVYVRLAGFPDFTYHNQDQRRREIDRDGLITVGDRGFLDEDNYLFIVGRFNDMVISGGVNIYPAEIEAVLIAMPQVRDCAVFGIPDEEYGESLAAVVEREPGKALDARDVIDFLRQRIAGYKVPKIIEFRSPLPREDSGKIYKRKLRDPYWKDAGRSI